ncbi:MAG: hypothetical protein RBT59_08750 [Arcobacteraceae bacterium]|jgi:hypothetical protein|nr:hypothetical protein [Arcobacteraceae bacterium]
MADEIIITKQSIKDEIKETYSELLSETIKNEFYTITLQNITDAVSNLDISGEKQAEAMIGFYSQMTADTITKVFDQSILLVERSHKLPKELNKLDKDLDVATEQENELKESVLDRQQKRPVEVSNLTKQGVLIDRQIDKIIEDKNYVVSQRTSMLEQVQHNKIIKAMDSMGDMIGTIGNGGMIPSSAMFGVYFRLNKLLTNEAEPTSYAVTKLV